MLCEPAAIFLVGRFTGVSIRHLSLKGFQGFGSFVPGTASVGGSPAESGVGCGSPCGQGHWQQKLWEVLLGMSPSGVHH